jgi:PAT family beta-lactamase induction signal transducer AmpG
MSVFGASGGLSFFTLTAILSYRLSHAGIDTRTIGIFALSVIPYNIRFIFPYLIDAFKIPYLSDKFGRRKSWGCVTHVMSTTCFFCIGYINPAENLVSTFILVVFSAVVSAIQDTVSETYRFDIVKVLSTKESVPYHTFGFRSGKLFACFAVPYLASRLGWLGAHSVVACVKIFALFLLFLLPEPASSATVRGDSTQRKGGLRGQIFPIVTSAFSKPGVWAFIAVFMIIKAVDVVVGPMETYFLGQIGVSSEQYGLYKGGIGGGISFIGVAFAGYLVKKISLNKAIAFSTTALSSAGLLSLFLIHIPLDAPYFNYVFAMIASIQEFHLGLVLTLAVIYMSSFCEKSELNGHQSASHGQAASESHEHQAVSASPLGLSIYHFTLFSSIGSIGRTILTFILTEFCSVVGWQVIFFLPLTLCIPLIWLLERDFSKKQRL